MDKIINLQSLNMLKKAARIEKTYYGTGEFQFGELRLPEGRGPFPTLVLIHGGCWRNHVTLDYIAPLAEWFSRNGVATWVPEYRRLGDEGGGWPGTMLDIGLAVDALRELSELYPLSLDRVYVAGHSAGGQLALWAASRRYLTTQSDVFQSDPLTIVGVIGLAAITNLRAFRNEQPGGCNAAVDELLGGTPSEFGNRFDDVCPTMRLPLRVPQLFIHGLFDEVVTVDSINQYVKSAITKGDSVKLIIVSEGGHFEPVVFTPNSAAALEASLAWIHSKGSVC